MCHKERKMGTMVERIQLVSPTKFLYNVVKIFANTSNALTPSCLRTPFGARHEKRRFLGGYPQLEGPISLPRFCPYKQNTSTANPYPQLERGRSVSLTGKRPCKKRALGLRVKSGPKRCPMR